MLAGPERIDKHTEQLEPEHDRIMIGVFGKLLDDLRINFIPHLSLCHTQLDHPSNLFKHYHFLASRSIPIRESITSGGNALGRIILLSLSLERQFGQS